MYTDPLSKIPLTARIAALVSGGVDSSVVVLRLVEAGFRPSLFYIRIGMQDEEGVLSCSSEEDIELCRLIARRFDLPFEIVSLQNEYWDRVVTYTIETARAGLTPNPDIMCNKFIKFGCFEEKRGYAFDYIATGHYAATECRNGLIYLATAKDPVKDQTDFLAQINFKQVSKLLFPIGHLLKSQVRELAWTAKIPSADRKDSQGICFLGKINYNDFLKRYLGTRPGRIIERETGKIIGTHQGYWFHTIGQRKGLGLSGGPWFVVKKDIKRNIILVSRGYDPESQYGRYIEMAKIDFITCPVEIPSEGLAVTFKVRHTPEFTRGDLFRIPDGFYLQSQDDIQGIAPGQYAVIYDITKHLCLGSGMITRGAKY